MTAFTLGPWIPPHFGRDDISCDCRFVLADGIMGAVCTVHVAEGDNEGDYPPHDQAVANANLIAAAPDLYAAAVALLARLDSSKDVAPCDFGCERGELEDAIAKARGGTP